MEEKREQRSQGAQEQATNAYSKYQQARSAITASRLAGRLATQAGTAILRTGISAIAAGWPVLVAVGTVVIITFVIVMAAPGAPSQEQNQAVAPISTSSATLSPTTPPSEP